ncbi:hypothetical protein XELAEV_18038424mg [Xenopus laevis]|uniref:Uncharacterized protein n=1 Tax=Xenopus laevis TaxID=8355 RepID=A0A974H6Z4_XENLA|nr:hypothetical protein XELAEV_18038424mg [Xenopus laevis]
MYNISMGRGAANRWRGRLGKSQSLRLYWNNPRCAGLGQPTPSPTAQPSQLVDICSDMSVEAYTCSSTL